MTASELDGQAPVRVTQILGEHGAADWHRRLHALEHNGGRIEILEVSAPDLRRHRFRSQTGAGRAVIIDLPRDVALFDGAVLAFDKDRAIVLRVTAEIWLRLRPADPAAALQLGFHAGNLHWRVRFDGSDLLVAVETRAEDYLARIADLMHEGLVAHVD